MGTNHGPQFADSAPTESAVHDIPTNRVIVRPTGTGGDGVEQTSDVAVVDVDMVRHHVLLWFVVHTRPATRRDGHVLDVGVGRVRDGDSLAPVPVNQAVTNGD